MCWVGVDRDRMMADHREARDLWLIAVLWVLAMLTHFGWEYTERVWGTIQAKRFFYAMQGLQCVFLLLALLYFCREISRLAQSLMLMLVIFGGIQESLVFACGAGLFFQAGPSPNGGQLCNYVGGWNWWVIGVCLALWAAAMYWSRRVRQHPA